MTQSVDTASAIARRPAKPAGDPERRERLALLGIASPAVGIITLALLVPLLWLLVLSFLDENGAPTLKNYLIILTDRSYYSSFWLTLWISVAVTAFCAVSGYLLAYALTLMPRWLATFCLAMVALPFWTSVLVRTYAWMVLLQNRGVVNQTLMGLGVTDKPIYLIQNTTGAMIGMIHIMLPFMVFPLYAALKRIDPDHMKAAFSFGASPIYAFWRVYFPQTIQGVLSGCVLVFVMSLGFYITPALLGGGKVFVVSMVIERDVNFNHNWGPASAVGIAFVALVLGLFALLNRYIPIDRLFVRER